MSASSDFTKSGATTTDSTRSALAALAASLPGKEGTPSAVFAAKLEILDPPSNSKLDIFDPPSNSHSVGGRSAKSEPSETLPSLVRQQTVAGSVDDQVFQSILQTTGVDLNERRHEKTRCEVMWFVDAGSGAAIMLNALHIGGQANCAMKNACYISPASMNYVDAFFAVGFALELVIRRRFTSSWRSFFWSHPDAHWHIFDTIVVSLSLFSFLLQESGAGDDGGGTLFSLFRLLRVTRLARVARFFRVFKQLTVMLLSLLDGMKTLVWAAMLLLLILYMIAILLVFTSEDLILSLEGTQFTELTDSLPMVMYVLFECMSEGCGNNIVRPLVQETGYRSLALVFYPLFIIFTVFGLLNLFTAMFVDNTMEAARVNEDRFRQARDKQSKVLAAKIQKLVATMVAEEEATIEEECASKGSGEVFSKQMFQRALENPEVRKLLLEMDISDTDHMVLFDVLDADGSGNLSVDEIVQGLVQVQGQARALDIVAVRLGMRAMQRQLKDQLTEQKEAFDRLTAELSSLRRSQASQSSTLKRLTSRDILQKLKAASLDSAATETDSASPTDQKIVLV
jgi:hypothetical protein